MAFRRHKAVGRIPFKKVRMIYKTLHWYILRELVSNAISHSKGNLVKVRIRLENDQLTLSVEDNGPGIPEDQLPLVMEPFVRLDTARRRDTVGFGLGLSIVARAVEAEGGAPATKQPSARRC